MSRRCRDKERRRKKPTKKGGPLRGAIKSNNSPRGPLREPAPPGAAPPQRTVKSSCVQKRLTPSAGSKRSIRLNFVQLKRLCNYLIFLVCVGGGLLVLLIFSGHVR